MKGFRQVAIGEELCAAVEQKFGHRFAGVDELVNELLRRLLRENSLVMDESERRIVEERLKELGYI